MKKLLAVLMVVSVFASGCSLLPKSEKDRFVDATIEATCLIFQAENIFDPSLEGQAKEIYSNYGFDADDEDAMLALTEKYQADADVEAQITAGLEECAGDILGGLTDAADDSTATEISDETEVTEGDLSAEEGGAMEKDEVTEEPAAEVTEEPAAEVTEEPAAEVTEEPAVEVTEEPTADATE